MQWDEPCLMRYDFRVGARQRAAIARLGFPRLDQAHPKEWICAFQIHGLKDGQIRMARGADGLQALTIASMAIRARLDRLKTIGPSSVPYEIIFPRYLPFDYGLEFHRKLCNLVDVEIKAKEAQLSRARRRYELSIE